MKRIICIIAIAITLSAVYICIFQFLTRPLPEVFFHPEITLREKKMLNKAFKKHGDYPIIREGTDGEWFMMREGEKIRL